MRGDRIDLFQQLTYRVLLFISRKRIKRSVTLFRKFFLLFNTLNDTLISLWMSFNAMMPRQSETPLVVFRANGFFKLVGFAGRRFFSLLHLLQFFFSLSSQFRFRAVKKLKTHRTPQKLVLLLGYRVYDLWMSLSCLRENRKQTCKHAASHFRQVTSSLAVCISTRSG